MKCLSRDDIETIARRVWSAYQKLPVHQAQVIDCVDPDVLLVHLLGLNIAYHHLSVVGDLCGATTRGDGVGMRIYDTPKKPKFFFFDGGTVLIERNLILDARLHNKCRFTKAHEAAHQILHMLYPREYGECATDRRVHYYRQPNTDDPWEEWQANTLAAAMLLPEDLIRRNMELVRLPERIPRLNSVYDKDVFLRFTEMADMMLVSKMTLAIRMQHLGIVDREYIRNPYALIDIY